MTKIERFSKKMTGNLGKVHEVKALKDLPKKMSDIAKGLGLKGADAKPGNINVSSKLGVSYADFGIAETGTLVFCSAPEAPPSLNFVPEFSIAVLKAKDLVETSEDVWAKLGDTLPRTLNMISGPSKTGDIEQTLFLGAHGPRELHVIIVKN